MIVGGGFAGIACAKHLSKHGVRVTLVDRHDYNQFQPLLYQVATAQVNVSEVARPMRQIFLERSGVAVQMATVTAGRPGGQDRLERGRHHLRRGLPGARDGVGAQLLRTPGAEEHAFSLYSLDDAQRLRSRVLTVLRGRIPQPEADRPGRAELRDRRCGCDRGRNRRRVGGCDQSHHSASGRGRPVRCGARSTWSILDRWCSRRSPTARMRTRRRRSRSGASSSSSGSARRRSAPTA